MRDFKKLEIWKDSYALCLVIYSITKKFPTSEQFGITSQLRRSSSSIAANISEGCGRSSEADFLRFLYTAAGSLKETENFIMLSRDLNYVGDSEFQKLNSEILLLGRKLYSFIDSIKNKGELQASSLYHRA